MSRDLLWLPDRHLPVMATIAHADDLMERLGEVLFAYSSQTDGTVGLEEVRHGSVTRTTVTGVAPLPRAIALYAADALTTLRAAVEHTLYAEVEHANKGPLKASEASLVAMPASVTAEAFDGWVAKLKKNGGPAPLRLGAPLLARMRTLQPYQRTKSPHEHPMFLLASHSNLSKHRTPAVAALRVAAVLPDSWRIDPRVIIPTPAEGPVRVGDVLAETPIGVRVPVSLFPTVGLNRPRTDQWPPILKELDYIATWVRTRAIPILITGTPDVDPPPVGYDTTVGHADERVAVNGGSDTSASERYLARLDAAIQRIDLPDILAAHPTPPDPAAVQRWIASLSDAELIKRTHGFSIGFSAEHAQRMMSVVDAMIEEIKRFTATGDDDDGDAAR